MNRFPFRFNIEAKITGFAVIYAIFLVGLLFILVISPIFPEGLIQDSITIFAAVSFCILIILGCIIGLMKSKPFAVTEEKKLTFQMEGSKLSEGELIAKISSPTIPLINESKEKE